MRSVYQKRVIKCSQAPRPEDNVHNIVYEKGLQKNPGFDKDKTDIMFGLTLYDFASFISLYVQVKVKDPLENKNNGPRLKKLGHPVFFFFLFFFSLTFFFRLIP